MEENTRPRRVLTDAIRAHEAPHAVLITGPEGSGKTELALECADLLFADPLHRALRRTHPNLTVFDSGTAVIRVDDIRALRAGVSTTTPEDGPRTDVIAHAQNMNASAQNSLLKILEEPPEDVYFFLLCENERKLLPTVLSRCVRVCTQPADRDTALAALVRRFPGASRNDLLDALGDAEGYIGRAGEICEERFSEEGARARQFARDLQDLLEKRDERDAMRLIHSRERMPRSELADFLDESLRLTMHALEKNASPGRERLAALELRMRGMVDENVNPALITDLFSQYFRVKGTKTL